MPRKAPEGFAEIASDHDSSSDFGSYSGPPIKNVRSSGRKRKQTQRFEAGPAKRGEPKAKATRKNQATRKKRQAKSRAKSRAKSAKSSSSSSSTSSSSSEDHDGTSNGTSNGIRLLSQFLTDSSTTDDEQEPPPEPHPEAPPPLELPPDAWVMQRLPTFAEKYPALHAQTTGAITASLGTQIYALVKDQVTCMDAQIWTRPSSIATYYLKMISQVRVDNDLQPIPNIPSIVDQVKTKWQGSYIASSMCTDHPLLNTYQAIANAMEVQPASPTRTCEEIFQECYDTTKTEAFKQVVHQVVNDSSSLLYAIRMWQEHQGSDNIKNFLIKYAHALYNRKMTQININIRF